MSSPGVGLLSRQFCDRFAFINDVRAEWPPVLILLILNDLKAIHGDEPRPIEKVVLLEQRRLVDLEFTVIVMYYILLAIFNLVLGALAASDSAEKVRPHIFESL